ncbi:nephrin-like protein, partial [Dinothrombium tinctorium]
HGYQQFFRIRPNDEKVVKSSDIELQCNVANQAGSVQWSKDGFLLGFDPEIPGFPRHSMTGDNLKGVYNLRIKDIQLEDEGDYQCQVIYSRSSLCFVFF